MKKIKSLSVFLLCICLTAAIFAGCSKISLEGKYVASIDLSQYVAGLDMSQNAESGEYYGKFDAELKIDMFYIIDNKNTFTTSVDEEKFKVDYEALKQKYMEYVVEGMYKYAESQGLTRAQFDEVFEQQNGKSVRDSFLEEVNFDEDYANIVNSFTNSTAQNLIVAKDRFYVTDNNGVKTGYETFTLENDVLTIHGQFDMNDQPVADENSVYPLVLTKVQ